MLVLTKFFSKDKKTLILKKPTEFYLVLDTLIIKLKWKNKPLRQKNFTNIIIFRTFLLVEGRYKTDQITNEPYYKTIVYKAMWYLRMNK